ncbi:MAG: hypothetical protein U0797_24260 [Gemmataceae bacterium]
MVADLADAPDYAHGMGLVHRDVKLANVMIELEARRRVRGPAAAGIGQRCGASRRRR